MGEDLKFTTAREYMDWYYNGTTEDRYETYVALADKDKPILSFEEWFNQ